VLEALRGVVRYRLSYYDAQIWAVARLNHVPVVLSEDFSAWSEIEGVRFENPFAPASA
jgi:predicted nucleic acid-binding protein